MGRLFSKDHIWICIKGETVILGLTDYAQEQIGAVMFLNLPEVGESLEAGKRFGDVESIKTVSDLISPVDGEVVRVNERLLDEPERVNEDPYGSWLIEVKCLYTGTLEQGKPAALPLSEKLMDEETYLEYKDEL